MSHERRNVSGLKTPHMLTAINLLTTSTSNWIFREIHLRNLSPLPRRDQRSVQDQCISKQLGLGSGLTCPGPTPITVLMFPFLLICAFRYSHASSNTHGSGEGMISSAWLVGAALPCQSAHRRVHWKMEFLHELVLKPAAAGNVGCLAAG